jgi:hypothetical protein
MRWSSLVIIVLVGCKSSALPFTCASDSQCGAGGSCVSGSCAFADGACPSGYVYDKSAGELAGHCVIVDMAVVELPDMAEPLPDDLMPLDMTAPPDLVVTCAQAGQGCTVGKGACARTGMVVCNGTVATCDAVPGSPDTTGTWHQAAATNGSWDWDCDGSVEYQYPSGDTTPPPIDEPAIHDCGAVAIQAVCTATHWYYVYEHSYGLPSCGHPVEDMICNWSGNYCNSVTTEETPQGCR